MCGNSHIRKRVVFSTLYLLALPSTAESAMSSVESGRIHTGHLRN